VDLPPLIMTSRDILGRVESVTVFETIFHSNAFKLQHKLTLPDGEFNQIDSGLCAAKGPQ
jgi:hypothetical protein